MADFSEGTEILPLDGSFFGKHPLESRNCHPNSMELGSYASYALVIEVARIVASIERLKGLTRLII